MPLSTEKKKGDERSSANSGNTAIKYTTRFDPQWQCDCQSGLIRCSWVWQKKGVKGGQAERGLDCTEKMSVSVFAAINVLSCSTFLSICLLHSFIHDSSWTLFIETFVLIGWSVVGSWRYKQRCLRGITWWRPGVWWTETYYWKQRGRKKETNKNEQSREKTVSPKVCCSHPFFPQSTYVADFQTVAVRTEQNTNTHRKPRYRSSLSTRIDLRYKSR